MMIDVISTASAKKSTIGFRQHQGLLLILSIYALKEIQSVNVHTKKVDTQNIYTCQGKSAKQPSTSTMARDYIITTYKNTLKKPNDTCNNTRKNT
jgi:hypothetical protein